ncbi:MAG: lysylphosphatidylglycerol synthase transmembrane domain-containing protein [Bacteroidota bacterium]
MDRLSRLWHWFPPLLVTVGLLWLAFAGTSVREMVQEAGELSVWWVTPFLLVLFLSHFFRAIRWNLLLPVHVPLHTLMAGVMTGYMTHYLIPRSGEVARPYYVASQSGQRGSRLLGTVLLERGVDVGTIVLLLLVTLPMLDGEWRELRSLLGWELPTEISPLFFAGLGTVLILVLAGWWIARSWRPAHGSRLDRLGRWIRDVGDGLLALRDVRNWPRFILTTGLIWGGYLLMSYWPLFMLDLPDRYDLGIREAWMLTLVSTLGVAIPTPGGVGSYHLLVQQSLWIFYGVPLSTGLLYATVTHASTAIGVFLVGAISLWADKRWSLERLPVE